MGRGVRPDPSRGDGTWLARPASAVRVVRVNWQQVCLGVAAAGQNIDVRVTDSVLQFFDGDQLLRTEKRTTPEEVRVKRAQVPGGQRNRVSGINRVDLSPINRSSSGPPR